MTLVNEFQLLTYVTKNSDLDVAGVLEISHLTCVKVFGCVKVSAMHFHFHFI